MAAPKDNPANQQLTIDAITGWCIETPEPGGQPAILLQ